MKLSRSWRNRRYDRKRWARVRLQVLDRDEWTCAECGAWANEVHHSKGKAGKLMWDLRYLVTLCYKCHIEITRRELRKLPIQTWGKYLGDATD